MVPKILFVLLHCVVVFEEESQEQLSTRKKRNCIKGHIIPCSTLGLSPISLPVTVIVHFKERRSTQALHPTSQWLLTGQIYLEITFVPLNISPLFCSLSSPSSMHIVPVHMMMTCPPTPPSPSPYAVLVHSFRRSVLCQCHP